MSSRDELMQSSGTIPVDSAAGKRDPPQAVSDHVALMVPRVTYFPQSRVTTRWRHSVSWFDAARFANWMQNGQGSGDTETGAYTLVEGQTTGAAPARNAGAEYYVPTENQWYKAAFYKGGGTNAGYWNFATGSDSAPVAVTAGETGYRTARTRSQVAVVSRLCKFLGNGACGSARDSCAETPAPNTLPNSFGSNRNRCHAASRTTSRYARQTRE
jgi:hypothetical protein